MSEHEPLYEGPGDNEGFEKLVHKLTPFLLSFASLRLRSHADVEDIVQDTWRIAWQKIEFVDDENQFRNWLCRICMNLIRRHLTELSGKGVKTVPVEEAVLDWFSERLTKEQDAEERWNAMRHQLTACIERLSESDQQLLSWRYREGLALKVIAELTGRPLKSISNSLVRVQNALHECVRKKTLSGEQYA